MHGHNINSYCIIVGVQLESAMKKEEKQFVPPPKAAVESGSGMVSINTQRHVHTQWTDTVPKSPSLFLSLSLSYGIHCSLCVEYQERMRCRATNFITKGNRGVPGLCKFSINWIL